MKKAALRALRTDDEAEALRMVAGGMTVREAARELGVNPGTVQARVTRALKKLPDVNAEQYRRLMVSELERVKAKAWELVADPPKVVSAGKVLPVSDGQAVVAALNTVLKALERQSRMLGVDAPQRQTVQVVDNRAVEEAIADVERQLALTVEGSVGEQGSGGGGSAAVGEVCAAAEGVGSEAG